MKDQPKFIIHSDNTIEQIIEPCEDCISREYILSKAHCCCDDLADDEPCCVDVDDIKEAPSVQPKPKTGPWIPVIERLPEEETDVLICNGNGDIELSRGSYSTEVENYFMWYTSGWRFGEVVAWMPLPEPYKAESEDAEYKETPGQICDSCKYKGKSATIEMTTITRCHNPNVGVHEDDKRCEFYERGTE